MPIDFTLTPEQEQLKAAARKFGQEVLAPCREAYLKLGTQLERYQATREAYGKLIEDGWIKIQIPESEGGTRKSLIDIAIIAEEFFAYDSSLPITWLVTGLGLAPIFMYGTEAQKKEFLEPFLMLEGTPLAALGFSEPTGSANYLQNEGGLGVQTFAEVRGDEVIINGGKKWASSSGGWEFKGPEVLSLLCRFSDKGAPKDTLGFVVITRKEFDSAANEGRFKVTSDIETHGFTASSGPCTQFTDFRVPAKNILAPPGHGALLNVAAFTESAALVGAGAAGLMRSCFEHTLKIVTTDKRGGSVPTISYQTVADYLISMKMREETTRYLTWKACHYLETTGETELAYQAKVYGSENAIQHVLEAMQAVGVNSYDTSQPYGKLMDDALCLPIFEGSNAGVRRRQIQKIFSTPGYDPESAASNKPWSKAPPAGFPQNFLHAYA
ncbi:acyl-CoA dehydrogenase domain-containing protein [Exophiala viscosa]|uniref:Acyl-CoA dehydrogenase domain-containing protein n=1 Tax=Exophiala viscosa TaxID=2486360 RepID=A0AAN6DTX1_9EURO|nr:acyl-CoA dehydrogenase domain-containing protein [Exophiala viscosa]